MNRTALACTALICATILGTAALIAGPLTPPAGAPASTYKTLQEVEPRIPINTTNTPGDADSLFKITQPGSCYLTGNITGVIGKHGIEIVTSGVTLDLNGFDLVGVPAMGAFDGVAVTVSGLTNIAVLNGSIRSWGDEGIDFGSNAIAVSAANTRIDGIRALGNAGSGILAGISGTVSNCTAYQNVSNGISTDVGCTVSNCTTSRNGASGISVGGDCTIWNCSATLNGAIGILTSSGCTVSNCTASTNSGNGITTGAGCTVSKCTAYSNQLSGISSTFNCTVSNCTASSNVAGGIRVTLKSTVVDCVASNNGLDGIQCDSACVIRGNTCSTNGVNAPLGAGVLVSGTDNRIEGNSCTENDFGIDVNTSGNIIIRNICADNTTNWTIINGNVVGPIVDRTVPMSAIINGSSAPSSLGTTDPNANFTY